MSAVSGVGGENIGEAWLVSNGARVLARNFRAAGGEIDIIAFFEERIVFVEVKARVGIAHGTPGAAITPGKAQRVRRAAMVYLRQNGGQTQRSRFDALLVSPDGVKYVRGAF